MPIATTIVSIITASAAVFTAVALVITAVTGLIRSRKTEAKIDDVHKLVNQQQTDLKNYQRALIAALSKAGVEVPADQSAQPGPYAD
jgi:Na+-transporting NADH:ubiquinone oxidoreductase subunit NqrF